MKKREPIEPLEDRVLTRMLGTPPDPHAAPAKVKKKPAKKPAKK